MSERISTRLEGLKCEVDVSDLLHAYQIEHSHDPSCIARFFGNEAERISKNGESCWFFRDDCASVRQPIEPGTVVLLSEDFDVATLSEDMFFDMIRDRELIPFGDDGYARWTVVTFSRLELECDNMVRAI